MNGVRIGLATVVLGLGGMSFGMRSLVAGEPCGPRSYTVSPPVLDCNGECGVGEGCDAVTSLIPGKPPITCAICMCTGTVNHTVGAWNCVFVLYSTPTSVTPACVTKHCTGDCGVPSYDLVRGVWVCKCVK